MTSYNSYSNLYGQSGQYQQANPTSDYTMQNSAAAGQNQYQEHQQSHFGAQDYDNSTYHFGGDGYGTGSGAQRQLNSSEQQTGGYNYSNQQWYNGSNSYQSGYSQGKDYGTAQGHSQHQGVQSQQEQHGYENEFGYQSYVGGSGVGSGHDYSGDGVASHSYTGPEVGGSFGGYSGIDKERGRGGFSIGGDSGGGRGESRGRGRGWNVASNRGRIGEGGDGVAGRGRGFGSSESIGFGNDSRGGFIGERVGFGASRGAGAGARGGFDARGRGAASGFREGRGGGTERGRGLMSYGGRGRGGEQGMNSGSGRGGASGFVSGRGRGGMGRGDGNSGRAGHRGGSGLGERGGGSRGGSTFGGERGRGRGAFSNRGSGAGGERGRGGSFGRGGGPSTGNGNRGRGSNGGGRGSNRGGGSGRGGGAPKMDDMAKGAKRKGGSGGPPAKRLAMPDPHSLVPKKYVGIVMKHSDPLIDKLTKLKQLLKEEGITKLHIVPKIDQLGCKTAIIIENVYRFASVPIPGFEDRTPVFCELYMDKMLMASGECDTIRNAAMRQAYEEFTHKIGKQPLEQILRDASRGYMWADPSIYTVVQKKHLEDNDSLLTTNLANMKQMMQCDPNLALTLDKFVLMEFESDMETQNSYKKLELSATRNTMLLECEIVRNPDQRYTCLISMQGNILCSRINTTRNSAKRSCSDNIVKELSFKCDIVHVAKQMDGIVHFRSTLMAAARKYRTDGVSPLKCALHKKEVNAPTNVQDIQRMAADSQRSEEIEALPENMADRPYLPWMGRALADLLLDYHKRITLEDFRVHINDMPKSMRDAVQVVAMKMGLKMVSKFKETTDHAVLRRPIPALEITKILALHNGYSGRLSMKQTKHPWPAADLKTYKQEYVAKYTKMYNDLLKEDDTA